MKMLPASVRAGASAFQGFGVCVRLGRPPAARVGGGFHRERSVSGEPRICLPKS